MHHDDHPFYVLWGSAAGVSGRQIGLLELSGGACGSLGSLWVIITA